MLYILYGDDSYSLKQRLEEIKRDVGTLELLDANTTIVDGREVTLKQLLNLCSAAPFLSEKRLVIVENLLSRFDPRPEDRRRLSQSALESKVKEMEEWKALSSHVEQMPTSTILVLTDSDLKDMRNGKALLKVLSSVAKVVNFPELKGVQLRDWITNRVSKDSIKITPQVINMLSEAVGGDLWAMEMEIEKLIVFCHGRSIREEDVRQLVSYVREPNILAMLDAILEAKIQIAQKLLHQLLKEGTAPSYILFRITRQLRLIVLAKELDPKLPREEGKKRLGFVKDYPYDKTLAQAKSYTLERIRQVYHKLVDTDLSIKTGKYDGDLALDLLVIELGQLQEARHK